MGDTVFHYQYFPDGLFLLVRDSWENFRFVYNDLQSRSITLGPLPLAPESYEKVRFHFVDRYVGQQRRLALRQELDAEVDLLRRLEEGDDRVEVAGLGLFSVDARGDPAALRLRRMIDKRLGGEYLRQALGPLAGSPGGTGGLSRWSAALTERVSLREALLVLLLARPLRDDALLSPLGGGGPLSAPEIGALEKLRRRTEESVVSLLSSERPDRGRALLLQIARFMAADRSLADGVLKTLDPYPGRAERLPLHLFPPDSSRFAHIREGAREAVKAWREIFSREEDPMGIAYNRLEGAQGWLSELERLEKEGRPVRIGEGILVPGRTTPAKSHIDLRGDDLTRALTQSSADRKAFEEELSRTHSFNLITRNCATVLIRTLNEAFDSPEEAARHLGGRLEPGEKLSFVPFRFVAAAKEAFPVEKTILLPSYRKRQIARMTLEEGPIARLRESTTVTSALYEPLPEDTVFLFFTDDLVWPRPLLGTLNAAYAALHGLGGLAALPVDRGRHLKRSLRGLVYSLPELAFFNIRKGSFPAAPKVIDR